MFRDLTYILRESLRRPPSFVLRRAVDGAGRRFRALRHALGARPYAPRFSGSRVLAPVLDVGAVDRALRILERRDPQIVSDLIARADRISSLEVDVLSKTLRLDPAADWSSDPVSGYRWPRRFHTGYRYADLVRPGCPSDIKVPWELGRLQFLPLLALAYRISGRRRYTRVAAELVEGWTSANPVGVGIGWVVGMEVALRAISLILTLDLAAAAADDVKSKADVPTLLAEHGRFLYRNVEYSDINGNHHTACLLGLLYLGLALPGESESAAWTEAALAGLREAIRNQVHEDGVCHEGSIPYHRFVAEMLLHATALCRRNSLGLPGRCLDRVAAMLDFCHTYMKPSGQAPVWGDNDDGRLHALGAQPLHDHRYLLAAGSLLFDREDLWPGTLGLSADLVPLMDSELVDRLEERLGAGPAERGTIPESRGFPAGGFYILRLDDGYCLIDCGDVGLRGRGGHGHNDALAVEVALAGLDVLTDLGCAAYTRSLQDRERTLSAAAHSVATIDGLEPAPIQWTRFPHASACPVELLAWEPETHRFEGAHDGYSDRAGLGRYQREARLESRSSLAIRDHLNGSGVHRVTWRFHLAKSWRVSRIEADAVHARHRDGARLLLDCRPTPTRVAVEETVGYPRYDRCEDRQSVVMEIAGGLPCSARFSIRVHPPVRAATVACTAGKP